MSIELASASGEIALRPAFSQAFERLFPFQREGVARLVRSPALLLADEMGLGKTIQAIMAIRVLKARQEIDSTLVVAPAGLVLQWRRQLRQWAPELRLATAVGGGGDRMRAWRDHVDVYLTNYESLRSDIGLRHPQSPGQRTWDLVVIDEAQKIKSRSAAVGVALKRLRRNRSWALTGTPLENRLDDLTSIIEFVAPGRFEVKRMAVGLRQLLAEVQLRRRRRDVLCDLPPKLHSVIPIILGSAQQRAYELARNEGLMRLSTIGREIRITHVLELILRLKQICNFCPETGESAKLSDLRERLAAVLQSDEKALVFSQFVLEPFGAKRLARELASLSPLVYAGDLDATIRSVRIAEFERHPAHRLLVLSLRAGGVGLNLTAASHVFHFDRWWNPAVETQAEDRTHRIGQRRPVHVFAYTCVNTIEERIEDILAEKRTLFEDVVDGVETSALRRIDLDTLLTAIRSA